MLNKIKYFVIITLFVTSFSLAQMASGDFFFDKSVSGYTLDKNSGSRVVEKEITFSVPFESKPQVYTSITVVDAANKTKIRYSVEAKAVSRDGFILKVTSWGDTQINGIGGNWFAHAEKLEIKKEEIAVGTTFQLNNVYFDFNKATLLADSYDELDRVVKFLTDNAKVEIEISGHTDNIGADKYNMELSQKRADATKAYIVSKGIAANRIVTKGYGKDKPLTSNATDAGREQNRRVEFTILKN
jgi:outer membrane protein OmpA-like peptidoglycan-associated protein